MMDIDQVRTFLAVAANGSFIEAASRLHVTQSTVSARIQNLELYLGARLFVRNRAGASLTTNGQRFVQHAKALILTLDQARHDVGLPSRFRASIRIAARIALWEDFLPAWVGYMRTSAADVSIRSDIGFEDDLMRRMTEGALDIALMYTPQHSPELLVEHLFDETLVLVSTSPDPNWPNSDYIYVNWGPGFYAQHNNHFPDLERPAQDVSIGWLGVQLLLHNGGSCYLPLRVARPFIQRGQLFSFSQAPRFRLPAYMVFSRQQASPELTHALDGLRLLAAEEQSNSQSELSL